METVKCPQCGSTEIVPIVYGQPVEIAEALQSVDWALGGCAIFLSIPDTHCKGCNHEWRKAEPESKGDQGT